MACPFPAAACGCCVPASVLPPLTSSFFVERDAQRPVRGSSGSYTAPRPTADTMAVTELELGKLAGRPRQRVCRVETIPLWRHMGSHAAWSAGRRCRFPRLLVRKGNQGADRRRSQSTPPVTGNDRRRAVDPAIDRAVALIRRRPLRWSDRDGGDTEESVLARGWFRGAGRVCPGPRNSGTAGDPMRAEVWGELADPEERGLDVSASHAGGCERGDGGWC